MNTVASPPLPLRDLRPALLAALIASAGLALVSLDTSSLLASGSLLHELMHDGRHLLGVPCH